MPLWANVAIQLIRMYSETGMSGIAIPMDTSGTRPHVEFADIYVRYGPKKNAIPVSMPAPWMKTNDRWA